VGNKLSDHPESSLGKTYIIENVSQDNIYAVHNNGYLEMKTLKRDEIPEKEWWVFVHVDQEQDKKNQILMGRT
jgi:hypothetical protein